MIVKNTLIPKSGGDDNMPAWLKMCIDMIVQRTSVFPDTNIPNHVLVNEYLSGQGIMVRSTC